MSYREVMCFSATASFTASAVLLTIGSAGLVKHKRKKKSTGLLLASIPLFFAIQQFSEGLVWLAMANPGLSLLASMGKYIFLFFAFGVWPSITSAAVIPHETQRFRRGAMRLLWALGALLGVWLLYNIFTRGAAVHFRGNLLYAHEIPRNKNILYLYVLVTCSPFLLCSRWRFFLLGILGLGAFVVADLLYTQALTSVWCFFAAVISSYIYFLI